MSVGLVLLRIFLLVLIYLSGGVIFNTKQFALRYSLVKLALLGFLYFSFIRRNFILFYFRFEASLIPTLYIIIGWGYQPERLQAGVYFLIYTLLASLPLLLVLL